MVQGTMVFETGTKRQRNTHPHPTLAWAQAEALHQLAAGCVRSASHIRKPDLTMVFGDQKQKVSYVVPLDLEVLRTRKIFAVPRLGRDTVVVVVICSVIPRMNCGASL